MSSRKYASIDRVGFRFDVQISRWRPWRHFKVLPPGEWQAASAGAYAAASAGSWSRPV